MMKLFPGDVVEITTEGGLAYVQVTHNHVSYPEVVRALPGLHGARPELAELANAPTVFSAMFPLGGALEQGRISGQKVGNYAIPDPDKAFPTFRMPVRDKQGNVIYWWLWDGEGLRFETGTEPANDKLPAREVMPLDSFMSRLG